MVSEDILGGLRVAIAKGKSLEESMQAFYNAGYPKEEIEEAAKILHLQQTTPPQQIQKPNQFQQVKPPVQTPIKIEAPVYKQQAPPQRPSLPPFPKQNISQNTSQNYEQNTTNSFQPPQRVQSNPEIRQPSFQPLSPQPLNQPIVSAYDHKPSKIDPVTIILMVILLVLLGVLFAVFFYKDQLVSFLNQYLE